MEYVLEKTFSLEHSAKTSNSRTAPAGFLSVCGLLQSSSLSGARVGGTQVLGLLLRVLHVAVTYLRIIK